MASGKAFVAVQKAKDLARRTNAASIDLAKALSVAEQQQPGNLKEMIAGAALRQRRGYNLLEIGNRFADPRYTRDELARIGWTKLVVIARCTAPGAEADGIDLARRHTAKELEEILKSGRERERPRRIASTSGSAPRSIRCFHPSSASSGRNRERAGTA